MKHLPVHLPLLLALIALSLPGCTSTRPAVGARPNVIIINADDLGYGDVSCYGATLINTPHIDALAQRGRRFTDAHSAHAVCSPSRFGLMTGTYPLRVNVWGPVMRNGTLILDPEQPTLASIFQDSGYHTACIGKWHLGFGQGRANWNAPLTPGPRDVGFDYYFGVPVVNSHPPFVYVENESVVGYDPADPFVNGRRANTLPYPEKMGTNQMGGAEAAHLLYRDEQVGTTLVNRATQWIGERPEGEPYFLYLATTNIHHPFTPAEQFVGTSGAGLYGDFVHELDWMVGQVVAAVEARGDADNTLIIFTSDNGGMLNNGGQAAWEAGHRLNGHLLGFKFGIWEGGHRVPFIAAWPGRIPRGSESDALVSQVDLFATFASILEVGADAAVDSVDQLSEFLGQADVPLRDELIVLSRSAAHVSVRTERWLYIPVQDEGGFTQRNWRDHALGGAAALAHTGQVNSDVDEEGNIRPDAPPGQLYDLQADPSQTTNVYREHPAVVEALQARVDVYRALIPD